MQDDLAYNNQKLDEHTLSEQAFKQRLGREGATLLSPEAAHSDQEKKALAHDDEQLPMVVWLRGDESLCDEFTLDADAVMQLLGIRRSRLTQISGRELRVGRMRKGRYVSPVYRFEDVEQYRAWTRPTAAHQKSSEVLHEAAASLLSQKDELAEQMASGFAETIAAVEASLRRASLVAARMSAEAQEHWQVALADTEDNWRELLQLSLKPLAALKARLDLVARHADQLGVAHAAAVKSLTELAALTRLERSDAQARHEALVAQVQDLQAAVAQLHSEQEQRQSTTIASPARRRRVPKCALSVAPSAARSASASATSLQRQRRSIGQIRKSRLSST